MMFFLGMITCAVIGGLAWYLIARRRAGSADAQAVWPAPRAPSTLPSYTPEYTPGPVPGQPQAYAPQAGQQQPQAYAHGQQQPAAWNVPSGLGAYQTEYQVISISNWL